MKKKKIEPNDFWCTVQKQFESTEFNNVINVKNAMLYDKLLADSLIPFLTQQILITDDLDVNIRFDLLSENAKFNFISLLCISQNLINYVPDVLLKDPIYKSIYDAYNEKPPKLVFTQKTAKEKKENLPPPEIEFESCTPEFFNELDSILQRYPKYAEEYLKKNLPAQTVQQFYNSITGFYSQHRTVEGSTFVIRYVITPYILSLTSSANRLISEAILNIIPSISDLLIDELVKPVIFDPNSTIYQYEFIKRLLGNKAFCSRVLSRIFIDKPPSLQPKLNKDALQIMPILIQNSQQLDDNMQKHILLHIRTQINHWKNDTTAKLLIFFLTHQSIKNQNNIEIAKDSISIIPTKFQQTANNKLNESIQKMQI